MSETAVAPRGARFFGLAVFALALGGGFDSAAEAGEACGNCATVYSVREVDRERGVPQTTINLEAASSPGEFPGGLSGGSPVAWVAASSYQPGRGWKKGYVGAVGSPEMREAMTERTYEVIVKLDNGKYQLFREDQPQGWRIGDRVRIVMGKLVPED